MTMRRITALVVHCSATRPSMDIGVEEIRRWHVEQNGWRDIGYHHCIRRDGTIEDGRPLEQVGAHVAGHNAHSIGICLIGGIDVAGKPDCNFTAAQWEALYDLVKSLSRKFPKAEVKGHRDYPGVAKACPVFDVRAWWANKP